MYDFVMWKKILFLERYKKSLIPFSQYRSFVKQAKGLYLAKRLRPEGHVFNSVPVAEV